MNVSSVYGQVNETEDRKKNFNLLTVMVPARMPNDFQGVRVELPFLTNSIPSTYAAPVDINIGF